MRTLRLGEGKASLTSSPSLLAPLAEHTAHRWCQNLSEKQKLSGGKFPMPDWTKNKTHIKKKKLVSKLFLPVQCLVTQNLSRAARNFHLKCDFGVFLWFQGYTEYPLAFEVQFQIQSMLSQFCLLGLWVELRSDALFSLVPKPFRALSKRRSAFQLLCQRKWPK